MSDEDEIPVAAAMFGEKKKKKKKVKQMVALEDEVEITAGMYLFATGRTEPRHTWARIARAFATRCSLRYQQQCCRHGY